MLSVEDLLAPLYARPASFLGSDVPQEGAEALVQEQTARLTSVIAALGERLPGATVYPVIVGTEVVPTMSVLAPDDALRGQQAVESMLRRRCDSSANRRGASWSSTGTGSTRRWPGRVP